MTIFSINSGSFGDVTVTGIVSASTLKGDGSQITSVSYDNIASKPTLISSSTQVTSLLPTGSISSSAQINYPDISNIPANIVSSSSQVTALLPANTVSSSGQISLSGISGTTFSNNDFNFPLNVTVNGLLTATSQSIIYITSSQLNVGSNDIILNTTEQLRFGGLTIFDSGSANQSGSLFWDSLHNVWLYVHAGTSNTSSIVITGPENTGVLGSEQFLTPNRVPKSGLIGDHIVDSQISDNGTTVGISGNLSVTGSLTIATNALFVSSSGNVGIGTVTPQSRLDVYGNDGNIAKFSYAVADATLDITAPTVNVVSVNAAAGDALRLGASGSSVINITSTGRVGIGTTNPEALLEIRYDSNTDSRLVIKNVNAGSSATANLQLLADGAGGGLVTTSTTYSASGLIASDAVYLYASANASNGLRINTETTAPILLGTNNVERMRIDPSGYVLINATSSIGTGDSRLQIGNGTSGTNTQLLLKTTAGHTALYSTISSNSYLTWASGGFFAFGIAPADGSTFTEYMRIGSSGHVGIGTTNPGFALHVDANTVGSTVYTGTFRNTNTATDVYNVILWIQGASGSATGMIGTGGSTTNNTNFRNTFVVGTQSAHSLVLATSDTGRVWINSAGNVGIGTTNPQDALDVNGSIRFRANTPSFTAVADNAVLDYVPTSIFPSDPCVRLAAIGTASVGAAIRFITGTSVSLGEKMRILTGGNVGIGTTNPTTLLHAYSDTGTTVLIRGANGNLASTLGFNHGGGGGRTAVNGQWNISFGSAETDFGFTPNLGGGLAFWHQDGGTVNDVMRIKTNKDVLFAGNVGIGTTSPSAPVHVISANNEIMRLQTSDNTTGGIYFTFFDSANTEKGYIGYGSTGNDEFFFVNRENAAFSFYNNNNERVRIAATGELLTGGKTTVTANGGDVQVSSGITFPATQVAKSDANTLDDYEEGTWTPQIGGGSSGTKTAAAGNNGNYTKIGRQVFCHGTLAWDGGDSLSGTVVIKNLPFTSGGGRAGGVAGVISSGITIDSPYTYLQIVVDPGNNFAYIIQGSSTGYSHNPTVGNSGTVYGFAFSYIV